MANARRVGKLPDGTPVFRCDVRAIWGQSINDLEGQCERFTVLARNASEAANSIRDQFATTPCTQILTFGPKGGAIERTVGWETAIGNTIMGAK